MYAVLQSHWALMLASATAVVLLAAGIVHVARRSARGQLRRMRKLLDRERVRQRKAAAAVVRAERQRDRLMGRSDRVKPRVLTEAGEALQDAKALAKIAADRVLVAENHLRRVILEEFPPARHDTLRSRYLQDGQTGKKPFTF
jgi:hypothetical protein